MTHDTPAGLEPTHPTVNPKVLYVGTPIALITTMSPDGSVNIEPMSSSWALGRTIAPGWEASSQTLANLARDGQCVINYPHADRWAQVGAIATLTGHNPPAAHKADQFTYTNDKWTPGGFTRQPSDTVRPPRIAECAIQCEAEVQAIHEPAGPDRAGFRIVETYVRTIHADRHFVDTVTTHIDTDVWSPLLYVFHPLLRHRTVPGEDPAPLTPPRLFAQGSDQYSRRPRYRRPMSATLWPPTAGRPRLRARVRNTYPFPGLGDPGRVFGRHLRDGHLRVAVLVQRERIRTRRQADPVAAAAIGINEDLHRAAPSYTSNSRCSFTSPRRMNVGR